MIIAREGAAQGQSKNRCLWFVQRKIFGNRINWSGNTKQDLRLKLRGINGCQEYCSLRTLQPLLCHVPTAVATLILSLLGSRREDRIRLPFHVSRPNAYKCLKHSAARIRDYQRRQLLPVRQVSLLHTLCEQRHSVSQREISATADCIRPP
jgi:hypothetical protein